MGRAPATIVQPEPTGPTFGRPLIGPRSNSGGVRFYAKLPQLFMKPKSGIFEPWAAVLRRNLAAVVLAGGLGLCVAGCQSFSNVPAGNLASVTLTNQPMTAVNQAVAGVFASHGFTGGSTGANQFTYTHAGSRADNLAYGSFMFDEMVTVKVVVTTKQLTADSIYVGCSAWLVEGADDAVFQDDYQVRLLRKWPYEQLLKDIRLQLGQ